MSQTAKQAEFLTPAQVVDRWGGGLVVGTLANWRHKGVGPAHVKMRGRVLYRMADLVAWEAKNRVAANDNGGNDD